MVVIAKIWIFVLYVLIKKNKNKECSANNINAPMNRTGKINKSDTRGIKYGIGLSLLVFVFMLKIFIKSVNTGKIKETSFIVYAKTHVYIPKALFY